MVNLNGEYAAEDQWKSIAEEVEEYNSKWLKIGMVDNDKLFNKYDINRAERLPFHMILKAKFDNISDVGYGISQ
jgi:hypothetical protein